MWLLLAFIIVPLIEIGLFIQVGGLIGLGWTLAIVLLTALVGTAMVRKQGRQVMDKIRRSFNDLTDPSEPLAEGAMILFSGALLLTPGFFTDTLGLLLLVPGVRHWAFRMAKRNVRVQTASYSSSTTTFRTRPAPRGPRDPGVIDGEYTEVHDPEAELDSPKRPTHRPPSDWTRH